MDTGPFLSSSVADHSPKPTKDHRLGKLLPYQQSNPRQANFVAIAIFKALWITTEVIGTFVIYLRHNTYFSDYKAFSYPLLTRSLLYLK